MIDRINQRVSVPADMSSLSAQGEALHFITGALGVFLAASGIRGLQITLENHGEGALQVTVVPSDYPGDAEKLQAIGAKVAAFEPASGVMQ